MLNCPKELGCRVKRNHLNKFMQMLKNLGYNDAAFRAEVLESILSGYNKIIKSGSKVPPPCFIWLDTVI